MFVFGFSRQIHGPTRGRSQPRTPDRFLRVQHSKQRGFSKQPGERQLSDPTRIAGSRCIGLPNVYNQWIDALRSGPFEERGAIRFKNKGVSGSYCKMSADAPRRESCRNYSTSCRYCQHSSPLIYNLLTNSPRVKMRFVCRSAAAQPCRPYIIYMYIFISRLSALRDHPSVMEPPAISRPSPEWESPNLFGRGQISPFCRDVNIIPLRF